MKKEHSYPSIAFHITLKENVSSILSQGIFTKVPSDVIFDETKAVYLFPNLTSMNDALANWFGERFNDDDDLIILVVNIKGLCLISDVEYEIACLESINPSRILETMTERELYDFTDDDFEILKNKHNI